jgi:transposase InsO family protein
VSAATISRHLARQGLVTPDPAKRPRSSYLRFAAEMPNECWQSDFTHYPLAGEAGTEILTWLDDHSRYALSVTAHHRVSGRAVLETFRAACQEHGAPDSTLTDMVFTTRLSGGKGGRNGLEHELRRLGITQKNGKPNHPQTQGKVERFQQTLKNWLRAQPRQPATLAELQALLDAFTAVYNTQRPHRSRANRATPATAYAARPKAVPGDRTADTHHRVRADHIDTNGTVTLRHSGKLHHVGIGRTHSGTRVLLLVQDLRVRIINAATGELLRELVLDPSRDYQPTGKPRAGHANPPSTSHPSVGSQSFRCPETSHECAGQDSNPRPAA